jgi:thiol-disulfide isomerase/thioredoxin
MRIFFLLFLALTVSPVNAQYQFTLDGTTPASFNNKKIYLSIKDNFSENKYEISDSAIVVNNSFSFKGTIKKPSEWATLSANANEIKGFFYLVVDTGFSKINVRPLAPKTPLYKNKLSNSEVLNSSSNKVLRSIDNLTNYYYQTKGRPASQNKYVITLSQEHKQELRRKELNILKANPTLYYSLVHTFKLIKSVGGISIDEAREVLSSFSEELQQSALGKQMKQYITHANSTYAGNSVPVFVLKTNSDSSFSNSSLRSKPYILAFGATWCKPCKEKMPYLNQIQAKYKSKEIKIVYVNLDEKAELWKKQIVTYKMSNWINVSENITWEKSELVKRFNISAIPFYLIVDKSGNIIYNEYQAKDLDLKRFEETLIKL